ncbi:glycerophosphodiester phosphodiesterase family protein [uncultured Amnibacterium sp.]|uniref:glycerophosphodiester phosphodiesterase family protein n=1 Tax=uncultured Amnibacterium sp. TaxID=1631851 RepID=UPI0035CC6B17
MTRPLVLGHRGASGYRPELTVGALRLAAEQGADGIEVDVVPTRDGRLAVRHDANLGATTDVREALGRDARTDELDWADVARLRARERFPALRPASAQHDRIEPVLALPDVVRLAEELDVLLVVEIKDAAAFAAEGLDPAPLVARDLTGARCRIVLESFEKTPLDALAGLGHPLVYLMDDVGRAPDETRDYRDELADLASLARFSGVSLPTTLITPERVAALHAAGLEVWTWTLRPENAFLPPEHRIGSDAATFGDWHRHWSALYSAGVDAVFADHPDIALALRSRLIPAPGGVRQQD